MTRWALLLMVMMAPALVSAETLRGVVSVIDGDTLDLQGQRIRLHGVDAPESNQPCIMPDQSSWPCGRRVAQVLDQAVGRKSVVCEITDQDRYGRKIGVCYIDGQDINAWLVREGLAFAYRQYSTDYVSDEDAARLARKGIWAGYVMPPWDWRKEPKLTSTTRVSEAPVAQASSQDQNSGSAPFRSCREARAAGAAPVRRGDPGYSSRLDRDGDGVGCE